MFSKIVKYIELILNTSTPVLQYSFTLVLWYSGTLVLWYFGTLVLWHFGTLKTKPAHFIVANVNTNWNFRGGLAVQQ